MEELWIERCDRIEINASAGLSQVEDGRSLFAVADRSFVVSLCNLVDRFSYY